MVGTRRSRTAQGVAVERALLHDMGVVDDPYAVEMLTPTMRSIHRVVRRGPQRIPTLPVTLAGLAARVRFHDANVTAAVSEGVRQVVVVGAGYDSRAWRLAGDEVRYFEVDHPVTQRDKSRRAPAAGHGPTYVPADLAADDVAGALQRAGFDAAQPAVIVVEGVTMYLSRTVVAEQFARLAEFCAPSSVLSTDFYPPPAVDGSEHRRQNRLQRLARAGSGEGLQLLVDRDGARALLGDAGWTVTDACGAREVAQRLVGTDRGLPVGAVNDAKSFVAATLPR